MPNLAEDPEKIKQDLPDYLRVEGREPQGGELGGPEDIWIPPRDKYLEALRNLPESGGGGCHAGLLRVANYGRAAELDPEQVFRDLRARVRGERRVPDKEIRSAVTKAYSTTYTPAQRERVVIDGARAFQKICERGAAFDIPLLAETSPVVVDWPPERDCIEILKHLYAPDDLLFIGERYESGRQHVQPAAEWIRRFARGARVPPYIVPNPLTGAQGLTKDGKLSFRADSCVKKFNFFTVEFDNVPIDQQLQFYGGVLLPIVALIFSGGKSIHAWVRSDVSSAEEWTQEIEIKIFDLLTPLGVDSACKNESRLSRMPGSYRKESQKWQKILYLNPAGAPLLGWENS
jgi:hypothetical protein